MSRVQMAVFPAILVSIVIILLVTNFIGNPHIVLADYEIRSTPQTEPPTGSMPSLKNSPKAAENPFQPEVFQGSGNYQNPSSLTDQQIQTGLPTQVPVVQPVFVSADRQPGNGGASTSNSGCSLSALYPDSIRQWCTLIEKYSQQNFIDPGLVAALMIQESGGDPNAYSSSGAVGLMQVMPNDGLAAAFQCATGPCFSGRPDIRQLQDPEYNIAYGTRMLSELIQKYGSIREALKSYGPIDVGYYYADLVLNIFNNYR
jgi:hypothetical protein